MKYLTKEWYETAQRTDLHFRLQPIEEARYFSEELFQRLYAQKEQEHLDFEKRVCDADREKLTAGFSVAPIHNVDGTPITEEEREAAIAFQKILTQSLREAPKRIFDPEKAKAEYQRRYLASLEALQRKLPDEIKQKIADVRVFALKYATPEIIEEVTAYSETCQKLVDRAMEECESQEKYLFSEQKPDFLNDYYIHDHRVKSTHWAGKDLVIEPFHPHDRIFTFEDAEILIQECTLENSYMLYSEIYPVGARYEFHFLLEHSSPGSYDIFEFTLRCSALKTTYA